MGRKADTFVGAGARRTPKPEPVGAGLGPAGCPPKVAALSLRPDVWGSMAPSARSPCAGAEVGEAESGAEAEPTGVEPLLGLDFSNRKRYRLMRGRVRNRVPAGHRFTFTGRVETLLPSTLDYSAESSFGESCDSRSIPASSRYYARTAIRLGAIGRRIQSD